MKFLQKILVAASLLLATVAVHAQISDPAALQRLIDSRTYVFVPQTMLPMSGPSRPVTSDYELRVRPDSVSTYLPYFGRAYAPVLPNEGGISFTSSQFNYTKQAGKKGSWEIRINPRDSKNVREVYLRVNSNGYATVQVTSNNKQPISYYGYLK